MEANPEQMTKEAAALARIDRMVADERRLAEELRALDARRAEWDRWYARRVGPRTKTERGSIRITLKDGREVYPAVAVAPVA